jgi:hypothetical protein
VSRHESDADIRFKVMKLEGRIIEARLMCTSPLK